MDDIVNSVPSSDVYRDYRRMHSVYYWNYFRQGSIVALRQSKHLFVLV